MTDKFTFQDVVVARTIGAAGLTEVVLQLLWLEIEPGSMAILLADRTLLDALRPEAHGLDRVLRLVAVVGGHRQFALALGHPTVKWAHQAAVRFEAAAVFFDGRHWLVIYPDGLVETAGEFYPHKVSSALARACEAPVALDLQPQGWAQALIEQHVRPEDVTDAQRRELLDKLDRRRSQDEAAPHGGSDE